MKTKILAVIVLVLVLIQFIPISKNQENEDLSKDFIALQGENMPNAVQETLKASCYDCHSNNSAYPWYNKIAPVSWYIAKHIRNGKKHVNFSDWASYDTAKQAHKLEECIEWIEADDMPLKTYTIMHEEAKLNEEAKTMLINYFKSL